MTQTKHEGRLVLHCWSAQIIHGEPIGNPREMTILEFAEQIIELTGSRSQVVHESLPQDDPKTRQPDITAARHHLDWEPQVRLAEGLEKTVAYFRELADD